MASKLDGSRSTLERRCTIPVSRTLDLSGFRVCFSYFVHATRRFASCTTAAGGGGGGAQLAFQEDLMRNMTRLKAEQTRRVHTVGRTAHEGRICTCAGKQVRGRVRGDHTCLEQAICCAQP